MHLLKELVGWVLVAVVLHLVELAFLRGQHGVHLQERFIVQGDGLDLYRAFITSGPSKRI